MEFVNGSHTISLILVGALWIAVCFHLVVSIKRVLHIGNHALDVSHISNFRSLSPRKKAIVANVFLLAVALGTSALVLRPVFGRDLTTISSTNLDIAILLDISQSMKAEDVGRDSRLDAAKDMLTDLIEADFNNRYALITFYHKARTEVPLTYDKNTMITGIDTVFPVESYAARGGTQIQIALKEAQDRLINKKDPFAQDRQKIVLIVSDGEEVGKDIEDWSDTVKELRKAGIFVFTIGVGTEKGEKVPEYEFLDGEVSYAQFKGELVISKLDEGNLKRLAKAGSGTYFHADSNFDVEKVILELSNYIKDTGGTSETDVYREAYFYIAPLVLVLIIVWEFQLFNPIKTKYKKKK